MLANGLPCPNPTCTHTFTHAEIKGAGGLKCPRCGTQFHFGGSPAPAAKPPAPVKPPAWRKVMPPPPTKTPAPPPVAKPVARPPKPPVAPPVARPLPPVAPPVARPVVMTKPTAPPPAVSHDDESPLGDFDVANTQGPLVQRYDLGGSRFKWHYVVIPLFLLIVLGGGIIVVSLGLLNTAETETEKQTAAKKAHKDTTLAVDVKYGSIGSEDRVFQLKLPRGVWSFEKTIKEGLKATLAYQRSEPFVFLAVAVRDYGTRTPRDAELFTDALQRLRNYFTGSIQTSATPQETELPGHKGVKAHKLEFVGEVNSVTWRGECYLVAQNGMGYYLFIAGAPKLDVAQQEYAYLQQEKIGGFQLLPIRKGWTEQPPEMETFTHPASGIEVSAPKAAWNSTFKSAVPDAVLFLQGRDPKEIDPTLKNVKRARVLVLHSKKTKDVKETLKEARAALEKRLQEEGGNDKLEFKLAAEKPEKGADEGVERAIGDKRGRTLELRLELEGEPLRYVLLAVVAEADNLVVIECECAWDFHQVWRSEFLDMLATFRQKK